MKHVFWESPQVFDDHVSAIARFVVDGVAKRVFVSLVVEADDSPAQPCKALCFHLPFFHLLHWGTVYITFVEQMAAVFIHQLFCNVCQIFKWLHYFFGAYSLFPLARGMNWPPAVSTALMNCLLGRFASYVYLQFQ